MSSYTTSLSTSEDSPIVPGMISEPYTRSDKIGVTLIAVASMFSILAVLSVSFVIARTLHRSPQGARTHVRTITGSLMFAILIQCIGSMMSIRWIHRGFVVQDAYCSLQGGLKNAGNVGVGVWSFIAAAYAFDRMFLRGGCTESGKWLLLFGGWTFVTLVPLIGRYAIQSASRGPYYGISGLWCWVTGAYPRERFYLEYFIEFLSAGLSFVLYTAVLLRVRGNLMVVDGRWRLRWIARSDAWRLAFSRDLLDSLMLKISFTQIWFPIAYGILLIPIAIPRFLEFAGQPIPLWATIFGDVIFNLTGVTDALLILLFRRLAPDACELPCLSTKRAPLASDAYANGITPFQLLAAPAHDDNGHGHSNMRQARRPPSLQRDATAAAGPLREDVMTSPTRRRTATATATAEDSISLHRADSSASHATVDSLALGARPMVLP